MHPQLLMLNKAHIRANKKHKTRTSYQVCLRAMELHKCIELLEAEVRLACAAPQRGTFSKELRQQHWGQRHSSTEASAHSQARLNPAGLTPIFWAWQHLPSVFDTTDDMHASRLIVQVHKLCWVMVIWKVWEEALVFRQR